MLAHVPRSVLDQALSRPIPKITPHTETSRSVLERSILHAKVNGVAVDNEGVATGTRCIAAPVLRPGNGELVGALSITFRSTTRISPVAVEHLRKSAATVGSLC
jgi:DNA-binding IclR family transcriptional regulator